MIRPTIPALGFALLLGAGCNDDNLVGVNCPPGMSCTSGDGGGSTGPGNPGGPGMTTTVGTGTGTPFNPMGDGSNGVQQDPAGNIILDPGLQGSNQPIIWVANSAEGTVSKVDTRAMKEIARYYTYPGGQADPSRTTVSLGGDVVVANRAWMVPDPTKVSATKIAGDLSACVDRNHNGKIDTFQGAGPVPAQFVWQAGQAQSPDECVLWMTPLNFGTPVAGLYRARAAGFNADIGLDGTLSTQVYIGLYDPQLIVRLDGKTGAVLAKIAVPISPYGIVLDRSGSVWSRGDNPNGVIKIDPHKGDAITQYGASPCPYGITADPQGRIYTAGGSCVGRLDPATMKWETMDLSAQGATSLRGIAVDQNNHIWVAETAIGMMHVDGSKAFAPTSFMGKVTLTGGNNVGAAIDFDNKPWVISLANSTAYKVDPSSHTATGVPVGTGPYTYSDMTGFQLRNVSPTGVYNQTFTGCREGGGTMWYSLDYDLSVPAGSQVVINVRSATTQANLAAAMWQQIAVAPPGKPPFRLSIPPSNTYLQVQFNLRSGDPKITPILSAIRVGYDCVLG